MGKYRKRADKPVIVIPGVGAVADDRVLEGDYDRFVPGLLEVAPEGAAVSAPAPAPKKAASVPAPALVPDPETESEDVPDMTWLKSELTEYAESMDLPLDGNETKQEILDAIIGAS